MGQCRRLPAPGRSSNWIRLATDGRRHLCIGFPVVPMVSVHGRVVFDGSRNMYGTTVEGGAFYDGAIFELSPSGSGWQESVPFSFDESDGDDPVSLVPRGDGKYYGTTWIGGSGTCQGPGCGLVYEFVP